MSKATKPTLMVVALVVALVAVIVDNLVSVPKDQSPDFVRVFIFGAVCVVAAAAIVLWLMPWAREESEEPGPEAGTRPARAAFALALLALAAVIVFYTGLPLILGTGAFLIGREGEARAAERLERTGEQQREDPTQEPGPGEEEQRPERRASMGWAAALTGALVCGAWVVLMAIAILAD